MMGFLHLFSIVLLATIPGALCSALKYVDAEEDFGSSESGEISSSEYKFVCPGFWGTYADPEDCSKFYVCYYNTARDFPCPRNELYDHKQNRCRDKRKVKCGARPNPYEITTTTTLPTTTPSIFPPGKDDGKFHCPFPHGKYPDPTDCAQFYVCQFFVVTLHRCPNENEVFDERREECRDAKLVKCGNRPGGHIDDSNDGKQEKKEDLRCPYSWGIFPHPGNCAKFIICIYDVPTTYSCKKDDLFDSKSRRCVPSYLVTCDPRPNPDDDYPVTKPPYPPTCTTCDPKQAVCLFEFGRFAHPMDCSKFYACNNYNPTLHQCPGKTLYDERREECREAKLVKCFDRTRGGDYDDFDESVVEEKKDFYCPYLWGTFAHPEDCSKFIVCHDNTPKYFSCPENHRFDRKYKKCLPADGVDCDERHNPDWDRPTTPPPTTTTPIPTTTTDDPNKVVCLFEFGRFAHPMDCSKFYACNNFNPTLHQCPGKTLYDERREECREAKLVKCFDRTRGNDYDDFDESIIEKKEDFYCPYIWGTFAHPDDCAKYIVCEENTPTYHICEENHLFDRRYKKCLPAAGVDCDDRKNECGNCRTTTTTTTTTTTAAPTTTTTTPIPTTVKVTKDPNEITCLFKYGRIPDPLDCSRFYQCDGYKPTQQQCPGKLLYDEKREECREAKLVQCGNRPRGNGYDDYDDRVIQPKGPFYCAYPRGIFAHPENCSQYIICHEFIPVYHSCHPEYLFDRRYKQCLMAHQVDCDDRVDPRVSTTTKRPTSRPATKAPRKQNEPPPTNCHKKDANCIYEKTKDVGKWFRCPQRYGQYEHAASDSLFVICENFRPYLARCDDNTVFNEGLQACIRS